MPMRVRESCKNECVGKMIAISRREIRGKSFRELPRLCVLFLFLVLYLAKDSTADEISKDTVTLTPEEIVSLAAEWDEFTSRIDIEQLTLLDLKPGKYQFGETSFTLEEKAELAHTLNKIRDVPFMSGATDLNIWLAVMYGKKVEELHRTWSDQMVEVLLLTMANKGLEKQIQEYAPRTIEGVSTPDPYDLHHFELWTGCKPLRLFVDLSKDDETNFELTEENIEIAVRSRLRGARLYPPETLQFKPQLKIRVNVLYPAFKIDIQLIKYVRDHFGDDSWGAPTWQYSTLGVTAGNDANFILSTLARNMDRFLDAYLRVNDDAC